MRAAAVAVALAAAACSDPESFRIHLTWSAGPSYACPETTGEEPARSCAAVPMTCDARVWVRVVTTDGRQLFSACSDLPAAELVENRTLCELRKVVLPADVELPNQMVRIQMLVWSVDELDAAGLGAPGTCPSTIGFDAQGNPQLVAPVPAVGGEVYFEVGKSDTAELRLACPDWDQLDTQACRNRSSQVDVNLRLLEPYRVISATEADDEVATVHFGTPSLNEDNDWVLRELGDTLERNELTWSRIEDAPFAGDRCTRVLGNGANVTATATCIQVPEVPPNPLRVEGFLLTSSARAKLISLYQLVAPGAPALFPETGLVVGVVVDGSKRPVAGAVVVPTETAMVVYPNAALDGFTTDATGPSGYFLSTDARFGTVWTAVAAGRVTTQPGYAGRLGSHLSTTTIEVQPEVVNP